MVESGNLSQKVPRFNMVKYHLLALISIWPRRTRDSLEEAATSEILALEKRRMIRKGCFNCKKPGHFIVEYPELQKENPKKGSFQKFSFKKNIKKSLMETRDELDNEEDSKKDEEQSNLTLRALTSSEAKSNSDFGSKFEEEDEEVMNDLEQGEASKRTYLMGNSQKRNTLRSFLGGLIPKSEIDMILICYSSEG
ncbi:hypothetical protein KIW84_076032 [Lathyrus oleraceus]|uniref:CCHC-type domain-containing protein n=1 Tax=Pisum sativum TaxID=3888 RepID=A0A9D5A2T5_PEA|nr:hypothetical protein KIW84_076032 [Pisum sativum]